MFKKTLVFAMAAVMMFSSTACSAKDMLQSISQGKNISAEKADASAEEADAAVESESLNTIARTGTQTGTLGAPSALGQGAASTTIAETTPGTVLYDYDGITVTYNGMSDDASYKNVLLTITNRSGKTLSFSTDTICVDNFMQEGVMYEKIASGDTVSTKVAIEKKSLENTGVRNIREITIGLKVIDSVSFDEVAIGHPLYIIFPNTDVSANTFDTSGPTLYNKGDVLIVSKGVSAMDGYGCDLLYYVYNNSLSDISVIADGFWVNGKASEAFASMKVSAGKKAVMRARLYKTDLDRDGIYSVNNAQCNFTIRESSSYNEIDKAENVLVDFSTMTTASGAQHPEEPEQPVQPQGGIGKEYPYASVRLDDTDTNVYHSTPKHVVNGDTVIRNGITIQQFLDYVDNEVLEEGRTINRPLFYDLYEVMFYDPALISSAGENEFCQWMAICLTTANEFNTLDVRVREKEDTFNNTRRFKIHVTAYGRDDTWIYEMAEYPYQGENKFYMNDGGTEYGSSMLKGDTLLIWDFATTEMFFK